MGRSEREAVVVVVVEEEEINTHTKKKRKLFSNNLSRIFFLSFLSFFIFFIQREEKAFPRCPGSLSFTTATAVQLSIMLQ